MDWLDINIVGVLLSLVGCILSGVGLYFSIKSMKAADKAKTVAEEVKKICNKKNDIINQNKLEDSISKIKTQLNKLISKEKGISSNLLLENLRNTLTEIKKHNLIGEKSDYEFINGLTKDNFLKSDLPKVSRILDDVIEKIKNNRDNL